MGSRAPSLRVLPSRDGVVPPNAFVVLEGHVLGELTLVACLDGEPAEVTLEHASYFTVSGPGIAAPALFLVRPQGGEWTPGATLVLSCSDGSQRARFELVIGTERDETPPIFSSLGEPEPGTIEGPHGRTDVVAIGHGVYVDRESPIVLVELELSASRNIVRGVVMEGTPGTLTFAPRAGVERVLAVTLRDSAGNATRVEPKRASGVLALRCIAGAIEHCAMQDVWLASTDGGYADGFSRGHFVWIDALDADAVEISAIAARLTEDHELPIEIAFQGGFFGVTGTSRFYLWESATHWTGWIDTPSPTRTSENELRVVQQGRDVSAFVNHQLAGTFRLDARPKDRTVGLFFKGHAGRISRARFRDATVRAIPRNTLGAPASVEIFALPIADADALEQLSLVERRELAGRTRKRFVVRSGHYLDAFFLRALQIDLAVGLERPTRDDDGAMLRSGFIDEESLREIVPTLARCLEAETARTIECLHAHGGGTADRDRIRAALARGDWPESEDPAEEAAAFAFHWLERARLAESVLIGLCWEWRGPLR